MPHATRRRGRTRLVARKGRIERVTDPLAPPTPAEAAGMNCQIIFGHNQSVGQVLMQFSQVADRFFFTPDSARDIARQLLLRADLAEGKVVQG